MQSLPAARPVANPVEQLRRLPPVQQTASVDRTGKPLCEVPGLGNRVGRQNMNLSLSDTINRRVLAGLAYLRG
ncbi:hypothetical protein [Streptomyces tsukubensis]|uniref:hypothetical protein n=1 Tax=Streptomyces tsukubensis TaxID=83656 RepID=UPI001265DE61|nr:hypothetical protein [Streptomyces tsukubensis]